MDQLPQQLFLTHTLTHSPDVHASSQSRLSIEKKKGTLKKW